MKMAKLFPLKVYHLFILSVSIFRIITVLYYSEEDDETENFFGAGGSPAAMSRLLKGETLLAKQYCEMSTAPTVGSGKW